MTSSFWYVDLCLFWTQKKLFLFCRCIQVYGYPRSGHLHSLGHRTVRITSFQALEVGEMKKFQGTCAPELTHFWSECPVVSSVGSNSKHSYKAVNDTFTKEKQNWATQKICSLTLQSITNERWQQINGAMFSHPQNVFPKGVSVFPILSVCSIVATSSDLRSVYEDWLLLRLTTVLFSLSSAHLLM